MSEHMPLPPPIAAGLFGEHLPLPVHQTSGNESRGDAPNPDGMSGPSETTILPSRGAMRLLRFERVLVVLIFALSISTAARASDEHRPATDRKIVAQPVSPKAGPIESVDRERPAAPSWQLMAMRCPPIANLASVPICGGWKVA